MPKLVLAVRDQAVEPGQNTSLLSSVLLWHSLLDSADMLSLLEGEFFPKWFSVLALWLSSPGTRTSHSLHSQF